MLNDPLKFPPEKTTIFIAQNGPIFQDDTLRRTEGFVQVNLNDLMRRGKMGDKVDGEDGKWTKLSKSDVVKYATVKTIREVLFDGKGYDSSVDDINTFEKFYKENVKGHIDSEFITQIKVMISRDYEISTRKLGEVNDFIFDLLDNNIKTYYGTYLDEQGNLRFGFIIDGMIQSFLPSDEIVPLSDIPNDIIERSNLIEGIDYKDGNLIGSFVLGFRIEGGEPIYRLFRAGINKKLENGWQLGYIDPDTKEIYQIFLTDANSRKLYGRFIFENKIIKDFGKDKDGKKIDWWMNEELKDLIRDNYLFEGGKAYGIKLVSGIVTRYGNTYQVTSAKVSPISPHLLFNINYDYYETMWEKFGGPPRSRKGKLSEVMFLNYYKISDEIKAEARATLSEIYSLVKDILETKQWPEELNIRSQLVKILNARREGGVVILGPDNEEIGSLFKRFLGSLTGIDTDRNHLLYKVCFNDVRSDNIPFTIQQLTIRQQTMEQWDRAILEMFKSYTPDPNGDRIDRLIIASKITQQTKFSDDYEENPTKDDLRLVEILTNLVIGIFGRYTYEAMITGSILAKDGDVRFISHPWQTLSSTMRSNGLNFVHTDIPSTSLSVMKARGSLYRAESILLDMFTIGLQRKTLTGPDPETDFKIFNMPTIPMEKWMPIYREINEINPDDIDTFLDLLSYDAAQQVGINTPFREIISWKERASGNMKLFDALYTLYEIEIDKREDFSDNQKAMYKLMALESINFLIFSSSTSIDAKVRKNIREFLKSGGKGEFTLEIRVVKGFPLNLKKIRFDRKIFEFFKSHYKESEIDLMYRSLDPAILSYRYDYRYAQSPGVIEYYTENILRVQREEIINLGNWLKDLANNRRIEIRPFNTFAKGFAYSKRTNYLSFFPFPTDVKTGDQRFILDGRTEEGYKDFKDNYKIFLGGLLVDHQTFVISEIDDDDNVIRYLCAFNLLQGALDLDPNSKLGTYIPWSDAVPSQYILAPTIENFDETLYNFEDPKSIINIIKAFHENNKLIGYQRVGDRREELRIWIEICSRLYYIEYAF